MSRDIAFRLVVTGGLGAILIAAGCSRRHSDPVSTELDPSEIPPVPADVALALSSGSVRLSWSLAGADSAGISYRVYKAVGEGAFGYLGSSSVMAYTDDTVVNGTSYRYQVAGVKGAIEGKRSSTVTGVPGAFAVILDGGAASTAGAQLGPGTHSVRVDLVAPASTETYRLSEDPGLAGATVRAFVAANPTGTFVLSSNDGVKTIYGAFALSGGGASEVVSSSIRLDTRALISAVTEDSGGNPLAVNDVLHLTLTVDAPGGVATADIGSVHRNIRLFDDGTNGDTASLDGTYERDYVITAGGELVQEPVVGRFTDEVGNVANPVNSATTVTIADPPAAVTFNVGATTVLGSSVELHWGESAASDFSEYRLYRSAPNASASVDEDDTLVATVTSRASRQYTDVGLVPGAEYRWGIQVVDVYGFRSAFDTIVTSAEFDPVISGTTLSPVGGTPGTTFTYGCTYSHPLGLAPSSLALVVDELVTYPMTQVGAGTDWTGGETFTVDLTLGLGSHTFHFETVASDGSRALAPAAGAFGGPVVTE